MQRTLALVLLMVSFLWQALAVAGQLPLLAPSEEMEHAVLHWEQAGHHHNDDGTLQVDESTESLIHIASDGVANAVPMLIGEEFRFQPRGSFPPRGAVAISLPQPLLDGLRRPPRPAT